MNPLFRATAATLALVGFSDGSSSSSSSSSIAKATDAQQQQLHFVNYKTPSHLPRDEEYSIGSKKYSPKRLRNLSDDFIPPWADSVAETDSPTGMPTKRPTVPPTLPPTAIPTESPIQIPVAPTNPPTAAPTTNSPTRSPVEDGAITTTTSSNLRETSCTRMPEIGNFVTETLDIEYFLYLNDEEGTLDEGSLQDIVDSSVEPMFHEALVDVGLGCKAADFVSGRHVMVEVSSSGRDLIGAECTIDDDLLEGNATATECYTVWGQVKATMWFSPRRRNLLRNLQGSTTPFGDREAFNQFTDWIEEALESLDGSSIDGSDADVVKASFQGYVNLNSFDGTNTDLAKDNGLGSIDIASAFMDSGLSVDDSGIDLVWGLVAVIVGVIVLFSAIIVMVLRSKKRRQAFRDHARVVDDMALDSNDEIHDTDVVDDDSLFREEESLPEKFMVKLESADHDYRWIGEERTKSPTFVSTERNKEFRDHLATLKRKKDQEILARQYESAMI